MASSPTSGGAVSACNSCRQACVRESSSGSIRQFCRSGAGAPPRSQSSGPADRGSSTGAASNSARCGCSGRRHGAAVSPISVSGLLRQSSSSSAAVRRRLAPASRSGVRQSFSTGCPASSVRQLGAPAAAPFPVRQSSSTGCPPSRQLGAPACRLGAASPVVRQLGASGALRQSGVSPAAARCPGVICSVRQLSWPPVLSCLVDVESRQYSAGAAPLLSSRRSSLRRPTVPEAAPCQPLVPGPESRQPLTPLASEGAPRQLSVSGSRQSAPRADPAVPGTEPASRQPSVLCPAAPCPAPPRPPSRQLFGSSPRLPVGRSPRQEVEFSSPQLFGSSARRPSAAAPPRHSSRPVPGASPRMLVSRQSAVSLRAPVSRQSVASPRAPVSRQSTAPFVPEGVPRQPSVSGSRQSAPRADPAVPGTDPAPRQPSAPGCASPRPAPPASRQLSARDPLSCQRSGSSPRRPPGCSRADRLVLHRASLRGLPRAGQSVRSRCHASPRHPKCRPQPQLRASRSGCRLLARRVLIRRRASSPLRRQPDRASSP